METTRKAALANGDKYYDTGKPCKHGHYSKRSTSSWNCYECNKKSARSRWHKLSEAQRDRRSVKDTARVKKWRLENAEHYREYQEAYREKQREKKLHDKKQKEYRRQYQKAYRAKQRAKKLAVPE